MSKPVPLQHGQYYHVYTRGNNRENIFVQERNYRYLLQLYARHVTPVAETFAYCLLPNHVHFLVRIKDLTGLADPSGLKDSVEKHWSRAFRRLHVVVVPAEASTPGGQLAKFNRILKKPSQHFSNLFNAYARAFNKAYNRTGALFQRPFGRIPVTSDAYFVHLVTYIHRNPQKHGLVDDFRAWPYSSYHVLRSTKPTRLQRDDVLAWFGGPAGLEAAHRQAIAAHLVDSLAPEDFD